MGEDRASNRIGDYEFIRYDLPADAYRPYDPRFPDVAAAVIALISARLTEGGVEHIGSSAIPDCPGKGVIDLMVVYPAGGFERARAAVDSLGFQRYDAPNAHPEERPVRLGTIVHDDETFRLHVHIIGADAAEVATQRRFRDRLRTDPTLVAEYAAIKRAVLAAGVSNSTGYNDGKDAFIKRVIGDGG